jgi:hypothetical protein
VSEKSRDEFTTPETGPEQRHPTWCDRSRCTADPASQADGYRSAAGGQHRSADLPVAVRATVWPTPDRIEAYLTEAIAPWRCATFLHIAADGMEIVSMPVESATPILAALSGLAATATSDLEAGL